MYSNDDSKKILVNCNLSSSVFPPLPVNEIAFAETDKKIENIDVNNKDSNLFFIKLRLNICYDKVMLI